MAADKRVAGTVKDLWVDRSDVILRYIEVAVRWRECPQRRLSDRPGEFRPQQAGSLHQRRCWPSSSPTSPGLKNPDQITLLEEDKVSGYFAGGHMYATPNRQEPVL